MLNIEKVETKLYVRSYDMTNPHGGLTDWEEVSIDKIIDIVSLKKRQYKWLNYEYLIETNITINNETFEKYKLIDNHSTRKEMQEFCDFYKKWKDYEQG